MNWYYDLGGQRQGPVPEAELDRLLASGTISQNTLVWREGMADWTPLKDARTTGDAPAGEVPEGWIRCTATGRHFPPSQIVYLDGKPYSAEAKPGIVQGVMQGGVLPGGFDQQRTGPAWEQRAQLGFFPALWQTIKGVLLDPNLTFANMKRDGGLGAPLGFNVLLRWICGLASLFYFYGSMASLMSNDALPPEMRQMFQTFFASGGMMLWIGLAVFMPLFILLGTFIYAGILHLSLMICGGAKQNFETTVRTFCYVMGASAVFQVIPACGAQIGGIWGLVCLCMGIAKTHEIGVGRAVCGVLLPVVVCCVGFGIFYAAIIGMAVSAQGGNQ